MKKLVAAIVVALTIAGCTEPIPDGEAVAGNGSNGISYFHDDARGVSCWVATRPVYGGRSVSIDCLPDSEVQQ